MFIRGFACRPPVLRWNSLFGLLSPSEVGAYSCIPILEDTHEAAAAVGCVSSCTFLDFVCCACVILRCRYIFVDGCCLVNQLDVFWRYYDRDLLFRSYLVKRLWSPAVSFNSDCSDLPQQVSVRSLSSVAACKEAREVTPCVFLSNAEELLD